MPGSGTGTQATGAISPITILEHPHRFSAVWIWDNSASAWVNRTIESQTAGGTSFAIFEDVNDRLYLGSQGRFDLAGFLLTTIGSVNGLTWEYYDGTDTGVWTQFIPSFEYTFSTDGAEVFPTQTLANWATKDFTSVYPHAGAPPDSRARYWIRVSVSSITTSPTVLQIKKRPYAAYCTATDVRNLLQFSTDFSSSTTPTRNTVEDYIYSAQSHIEFKTSKSWRTNYKPSYEINAANYEYHEFSLGGFKLIERDVQAITSLQIWNGSEWQTKTQGRQNDYFFIPDTGMVYFSRYFLLPARLQSFNAPVWLWGWAEFTFAVRVAYFYGRDIHNDPRYGGVVQDITKKLAAIDIINNHDYSILTSSGADRITLDRKVENWTREIDDKLDSLRGWVVA